ncbi:RNA helicase [Bacillus cereus]|uniref:RNA helicase n=1 Tax=Bacillus cereus TaxID=1396 RepID=A0A2A7I3U7_BACCE|nr:RNA helicase [Bacillus cereus]PEC23495.1 RNA helicase [Bacillus cereus]
MSDKEKLSCGLIMPISSIDGCPSEHWIEVKQILIEAVTSIDTYDYHFEAKLVSESDDIGVIQKRIIQNVYHSDVVICDVSGKNPNVMFELGLRLAFDKPTIIIKDDKTDYAFDTSVIEHLEYPRDLRFTSIVAFKERLAKKLVATYEEAEKDPNHSVFLKNFGSFKIAKLDETEVSADGAILTMLNDIQQEMVMLRRSQRALHKRPQPSPQNPPVDFEVITKTGNAIARYLEMNNLTDPKEIGDKEKPEFYNYIEESIDAPKHFESHSKYRQFLDSFLLQSTQSLQL